MSLILTDCIGGEWGYVTDNCYGEIEGQSSDYDLTQGAAWAPFKKVNTYHIPDAIFEQYNQAQCHTMMGLFTEIGYAWMTVDNRLYMWEYATGNGFQGYEAQPNTITAARLLKPRPGLLGPLLREC